ncbi:MAG: hypothetical protein MN733_27965, partial [Nitrososphaera sp.]|nr:hypothetical protein [Nitrososphaera sp.]
MKLKLMLGFDDHETYMTLVEVCQGFKVDPSSSIETEAFFRNLLETYRHTGDSTSIAAWFEEQIPKYFVAVG